MGRGRGLRGPARVVRAPVAVRRRTAAFRREAFIVAPFALFFLTATESLASTTARSSGRSLCFFPISDTREGPGARRSCGVSHRFIKKIPSSKNTAAVEGAPALSFHQLRARTSPRRRSSSTCDTPARAYRTPPGAPTPARLAASCPAAPSPASDPRRAPDSPSPSNQLDPGPRPPAKSRLMR